MIRKCLFPAAGYGTRFLPATKAIPKEMLPLVTKPLIQYGVEEAIEAVHLQIHYYNNYRIHTALKMSPVQFANSHLFPLFLAFLISK